MRASVAIVRTNGGDAPDVAIPQSELFPMWVVYKNPSDFPGKLVVRRQSAGPGFVIADATPTAIVNTLDEARAAIPPGKINLHRSPDDDPCIAEVWL